MLSTILGRIVPIHQGIYQIDRQYVSLDQVFYDVDGNGYQVKFGLTPPVGTLPTNTNYFDKVASKGASPTNIAVEDNGDGTLDLTFFFDYANPISVLTPNLAPTNVVYGPLSNVGADEVVLFAGGLGNTIKSSGITISDLVTTSYFPGGVLDVSHLPPAVFQAPIVALTNIASLTVDQQDDIVEGSHVATSDGRLWIYRGTGSKTSEANYIELADVTPEWTVIANKPTTIAGFAITDAYTKTEIDTNIYTKVQIDANIYTKAQSDANTESFIGTYIDPIDRCRLSPSLDLNFSGPDAAIEYTRTGVGNSVNKIGKTVDAGVNNLRIDYFDGSLRGALFEGGVSNLLLHSNDFSNAAWLKSNVTMAFGYGPGGDGGASMWLLTATNASHSLTQTVAMVAGNTDPRTLSYYLRQGSATQTILDLSFSTGGTAVNATATINWASKTITASGTAGNISAELKEVLYVGSGLYRASLTATNNGGANTVVLCGIRPAGTSTGTVHAAWAQCEFYVLSSYVPTTSATASRGTDILQYTSATFNSIWNSYEGSGFLEFTIDSAVKNNQYIFTAKDGTDNNVIMIRADTINMSLDFRVVVAGSAQASMNLGTLVLGARYRVAYSYALNNFYASMNGGAVISDLAGTIPTVTKLTIGGYDGYLNMLGALKRCIYFPKAMPTPSILLPRMSKI